ncbi:MAG: glycosyltransferase family 39 protein [Candidatus Levybacteria bacterium]|nr:glycosyltransferase family 39 protein [Candidatus Levybacteria bacterium]
MPNKSSKIISFPLSFFSIIFIIAILTGIFLRFYNLSWGAPYFFHADERNIANSVTQLSYPSQMNPHFFAYGTLPIYSIYFTGVLTNLIQNLLFNAGVNITSVSFEDSIIIGRSFSFILSILLVFLIYHIGERLGGKTSGMISATLASLSVGFIQYAHFATFEIWLSFFTLLLSYMLMNYLSTLKENYLLYSGGIMGILMAIKVSSLAFLPIAIFVILITSVRKDIKVKQKKIIILEKIFLRLLIFLSISVLIVYIVCPYFWLDSAGFLHSINYESSVGLGTLPVFYTQGFLGSIPITFQLTKVYPFILNPFVLITWLILLPLLIKELFKHKKTSLLILCGFLITAFFSQAFLYVKWVRYYIPTLAFIYVIMGYLLNLIISKKYFSRINIGSGIFIFLFTVSLIYSLAYFKSVLYNKDTRLSAAQWADKNISNNSPILSELYDMGIVPFNPYFSSITLFDFYALDTDPQAKHKLKVMLNSSDYLILPGQRVIEPRINNKKYFPTGSPFYQSLLSGTDNFKMVYKSSCDIFCKILYLGSPSFSYEQTANVFDRPEVYIFKNDKKENPRYQK